MKKIPTTLSTKRLLFRKPRLTDAIQLYSTYTADSEVTHFVSWKPHTTIAQTRDFLKSCLNKWDKSNELNYLVETIGSHKPIGMIKIVFDNNTVNLGYVFAKKFWRQGYATETVKTFIDLLFKIKEIKMVRSFCDVENIASAKVMQKSGMEYQKTLSKHVVHPNISSKKRDCFLYAITKSKYESKRKFRNY